MSANKHKPHLLVIPEDDANRQIMTGFLTHLSVNSRQIHVERVAGGWLRAHETFRDDHISGMNSFDERHVLILIDFDNRLERFDEAKQFIPDNLRERVFVLGCLSEPEKIWSETGMSKEKLGVALAEACSRGEAGEWENDILAHNQKELERMNNSICRHLVS